MAPLRLTQTSKVPTRRAEWRDENRYKPTELGIVACMPKVREPRNGRGTRVDEEGVRLEGHFKDGELHGRGVMYFPDGGWQSGTWDHGQADGDGEYVGEFGERIIGTWKQGELFGFVEEYDPSGFRIFGGHYTHSRRNGYGVMYLLDGGRIEGEWLNGTLHGNAIYWYPDGVSQLKGKWKHGDMQAAHFHGLCLETDDRLRRRPFRADESTADCLSTQPLLQDPYEERLCVVKASGLCGTGEEGRAEGNTAGEGLFARCAIQAGTLVSWYNGVRVPHKEVDRRAWRLNDNTISLDEDFAIDVPAAWASTAVYRASLGHKANHSFTCPNAEYAPCFHPRFGNIKCIRALADVAAGDEILVDYGYTNQCPKWYLEAKKRLRAGAAPEGKLEPAGGTGKRRRRSS